MRAVFFWGRLLSGRSRFTHCRAGIFLVEKNTARTTMRKKGYSSSLLHSALREMSSEMNVWLKKLTLQPAPNFCPDKRTPFSNTICAFDKSTNRQQASHYFQELPFSTQKLTFCLAGQTGEIKLTTLTVSETKLGTGRILLLLLRCFERVASTRTQTIIRQLVNTARFHLSPTLTTVTSNSAWLPICWRGCVQLKHIIATKRVTDLHTGQPPLPLCQLQHVCMFVCDSKPWANRSGYFSAVY